MPTLFIINKNKIVAVDGISSTGFYGPFVIVRNVIQDDVRAQSNTSFTKLAG